jgi:ribokinase
VNLQFSSKGYFSFLELTIEAFDMSTVQCKKLLDFLGKNQKSDCKVVVMPDFFLDRIINLPWTPEEFSAKVMQVVQRKGGSLDGIPQTDMKGGNAINVASALSNLGAEVTPLICTSEYGVEHIKNHFRNHQIDLSHIKTCGSVSITTVLEFKDEKGKANVMIRDLGALADFGPQDLDESEYKLIESADYTCLFNWAGTLRHGTELAKAVFERSKRSKCRTYFDTADPNPNVAGIPGLISKVLRTTTVDILSLNENEAVTYASKIDKNFREKKTRLSFADFALEAARILAKNFSSRIDLHTTAFSASLKGTSEVVVPAFKVNVLRATGAGDAWCAGNILGDYHGFSDECRLTLANATSACYLSSVDGLHPTKAKLAAFLKTNS